MSYANAFNLTTDNTVYYSWDNATIGGTAVENFINGSSNNGTLGGGATTGVPGIIGDAMELDGANQFMTGMAVRCTELSV